MESCRGYVLRRLRYWLVEWDFPKVKERIDEFLVDLDFGILTQQQRSLF